MSESNSRLSTHKEVVDLVTVYAKWGTLGIGGLCLLIYSNEINQFPEGMNLGEGLAFYLVCAGFMLAYTMFTLVVTAMGSVLMAWPTMLFQKSRIKRAQSRSKHLESQLKTDYSFMWSGAMLGFGALGLFAWLMYSIDHPVSGAWFIPVPLMQGFLVALMLTTQRRLRILEGGLIFEGSGNEAGVARKQSANRLMHKILIVGIAISPMLLAPNKTILVSTGFTLAQLRKDNATIHIKKPWADRVGLSTLKSEKSFLGNEYVEFRKANVLLRSVGSKVVIELPQPESKLPTKLSIPSEAIFIE